MSKQNQTFILKLSNREVDYLSRALDKAKAFMSGPIGSSLTSPDDKMTFAAIDAKVKKLKHILEDDGN